MQASPEDFSYFPSFSNFAQGNLKKAPAPPAGHPPRQLCTCTPSHDGRTPLQSRQRYGYTLVLLFLPQLHHELPWFGPHPPSLLIKWLTKRFTIHGSGWGVHGRVAATD